MSHLQGSAKANKTITFTFEMDNAHSHDDSYDAKSTNNASPAHLQILHYKDKNNEKNDKDKKEEEKEENNGSNKVD